MLQTSVKTFVFEGILNTALHGAHYALFEHNYFTQQIHKADNVPKRYYYQR